MRSGLRRWDIERSGSLVITFLNLYSKNDATHIILANIQDIPEYIMPLDCPTENK